MLASCGRIPPQIDPLQELTHSLGAHLYGNNLVLTSFSFPSKSHRTTAVVDAPTASFPRQVSDISRYGRMELPTPNFNCSLPLHIIFQDGMWRGPLPDAPPLAPIRSLSSRCLLNLRSRWIVRGAVARGFASVV